MIKNNQKMEKRICRWSLVSFLLPLIALGSIIGVRLLLPGHDIISVPLGLFPLFLILAIISGLIAIYKISKYPNLNGKWLALVGVILGLLLMFLFMALFTFGTTIN